MDFEPDVNDLDVRTAAVIWSGDNDPEIMVTGCSNFEAIGLFVAAIFMLASQTAEPDEDDED